MDGVVAEDLVRRARLVFELVELAVRSGLAADLEEAQQAAAGLRWALVVALAPGQEVEQ